MKIYGERAPRADAEALVFRRIGLSDMRHRYPAHNLRDVFELRPIVYITTPLHGRHDRPYGTRLWGVFVEGVCAGYVAQNRDGKMNLAPYGLSERQYQIDDDAVPQGDPKP